MKTSPLKRLLTIMLLLCGLTATLSPAAEDTAADAPPTTASGLVKSEFFTGAKPNLKAEYYIFIYSASWCGFCPPVMKASVEAYPEMKRKGVELILVDQDKTLAACKDYVKKYKAKFPAAFGQKATKLNEMMRGKRKSGGVPHAVFLDANRGVIKEGHGNLVKQWQEILFSPRSNDSTDSTTTDSSSGGATKDLLNTGRDIMDKAVKGIGNLPLF